MEKGKQTIKTLLALINAYYDESTGYSNVSSAEINAKYGIAKNSISSMFKRLCEDGFIEDCTVNGYYKRFKILNPCPHFVLRKDLTANQKNFILKCYDTEVTSELSAKEIARRVYNSENVSNVSRTFKVIESAANESIFSILQNDSYIVCGLCPENAESTEFGYKTSLNKTKFIIKTEEDKIANRLIKKSLARFKKSPHIKDYNLTEEYIKQLLEKQNYKDYYTKQEFNDDYSIDRIDSSKGYVEGNVVITTSIINTMKSDLTTEEFKNQIKLLYNNLDKF